ncbi:MAG: COQ9 family protein [Alphaproteobacteria bacterium]|nr:COQ9 family protein [Alphaproteobacteria bacterium]
MDERDEIKKKIIKRALIHIPFEGWTQDVLERAAIEEGYDPSFGWRLFPSGPIEAISYWSHLLDQEMLHALLSPENLKVREKVTLAVKTRLMLLIPYREAARKTANFLSLPHHMARGTKLLYQTVNEIWYYAGDTSTDYNFYTKRGLLAWVYSATFLYWLRDHSDNFENTWTFLDRRIEEVLTLPKLPQKILRRLRPWKQDG